MAAAAALEKLRKEAEAAKQLAEMSAAAHTYGVDRAADRQNAALVVTRLNQLQNVCSHTEVHCCSWAFQLPSQVLQKVGIASLPYFFQEGGMLRSSCERFW